MTESIGKTRDSQTDPTDRDRAKPGASDSPLPAADVPIDVREMNSRVIADEIADLDSVSRAFPIEGEADAITTLAGSAFELAPIGMMLCRADGVPEKVNPALCRMLGTTERDLLHGGADLTDPDEYYAEERLLEQLADPGVRVINASRRFRRATDGVVIHTRMKVVAERNDAGELQSYLVQIIDISETIALQRELERAMTTDALTGLDDRAMVMRRLDQELGSMANAGKLALVLVDVSQLRDINEAWGPAIGDSVLVAVSDRLGERLPDAAWIGRVAGDEFAVVLPETDAPMAVSVAEDLNRCVEEPVSVGGRHVPMSFSIGVACYPYDAVDAPGLMRCADIAMRQSNARSNRIMVYVHSLQGNAADRMSTEVKLRKALREGTLELTFEPVLDALSGELGFCEALVRWRRDGKLVGPTTFIDIAEQRGLVHDIDSLVLRRAMRQMGRMTESQRPDVSVNLSPISLLEPRLVERILVQLSYHGLPPSSLIVEMTETSLAGHHEQIQPTLQALRRHGIRVAIDDFGAGYTSLGLLRKLEIDIVKIDASFIRGIGHTRMDETIIRSVIAIARDRAIEVVAEGVERPEQLRWLLDAGCDFVQGHLFRRARAA